MFSAKPVYYIDRKTNTKKRESIYGDLFLSLLYANNGLSKFLVYVIAHLTFFSKLYGYLQNSPFTKKKIFSFVAKYQIDSSEFEKPLHDFTSFNDFFCRKLKKETRPLCEDPSILIAPADGRYLVIPQIAQASGFYVKGKKFSIKSFLQEEALAQEYAEGAMLIARLCPTDYHRFHFPTKGCPSPAKLINGPLWSVNPIATTKNIHLLSQNKRMITRFHSEFFGQIIYVEVGATNVGSIHQTYQPNHLVEKGDEKGFFSFGGSSIILLFKPNYLQFDQDLINNSAQHIETLILMGSSIGMRKKNS